MSKAKPFLLNGKWTSSDKVSEVTYPYDGRAVDQICLAGQRELEKAIEGAVKAFEFTRQMPSYARADILSRISDLIRENADDLAISLTLEVGKPIVYARAEVKRAVTTFAIAAEEAKRVAGEFLPLDFDATVESRYGIVRRFPLGPVLGITPFNFPLNLAAHKIAPAIAVGNPIIIKPATKTPLTTLKLGAIMLKAGVPEGSVSILPCKGSDVEKLVYDPRIKVLTFTGSLDIGWRLKKIAFEKKVTLELGGNAASIVHSDAAIDHAVERITWGSFAASGQICSHVQRLYVHEKIYGVFLKKYLDAIKEIKIGDPLRDDVRMGPMIDHANAIRIEEWVSEAVGRGAKILCGGKRQGLVVEPTVLENTPFDARISCVENFGPVTTVDKYAKFEEAVAAVNNSIYGLQAGVFTRDLFNIEYAYKNINVGGLIVNDVPTWRIDHMPYGGVKKSGFGREGIRYAIEDMTEPRLLALNFKVG